MSDVMNAGQGSLYIQFTPGKAAEYMACLDLDPVNEPLGNQTVTLCRQPDGSFKAVGATTTPPEAITTSIKAKMYPQSDALDRIRKCLVTVYVSLSSCGRLGIFAKSDRGYILHHAKVTARRLENLVSSSGSDPVLRTLDVTAWNPLYEYRKLSVSQEAIAELSDLSAIASCNIERCAGDCGVAQDAGQNLIVVSKAPAGSPADRADVWGSDTSGSAWDNVAGDAGHPFDAGEDIVSVGCFEIDRDTVRHLVVRESIVGEPLHVSYSDDDRVTWTEITVGSVNNEGGTGPHCLVALDQYHIWLCTTAGNVYKSTDGGLTWTLTGASSASSAVQLNALSFVDASVGWAVGNTNTVIYTLDGGDTWAAVVGPAVGINLNAVQAWSRYRVIVGGASDTLAQTWDAGETWEDKNFANKDATGTVKDIQFPNEYTGFMIRDSAAPVGAVYFSANGGHDWEHPVTPPNAGLNAIVAVTENLAQVVGNAYGGTAIIFKVSG